SHITIRVSLLIEDPFIFYGSPIIGQVTKKKDLTDFYFGLAKNVALGARTHDSTEIAEPEKLENKGEDVQPSKSDAEGSGHSPKRRRESSVGSDKAHESRTVVELATTGSKDSTAARSIEKEADVSTSASQALQNAQPAPITDEHYKRSNDALAAARERALACKRAKEQQI
ncbi:hypothetical protein ZWY2020_058654, partial [Hordeum vulgare]